MNNIVEMKNICKSFSGVKVLDNVCFQLKPGEIHALVGENGAGKSTLIKILSGAYQKDSGEILINDETVDISGPSDAKNKGIQCIYQELSLVPHLSVANNIFLGQEISKSGFVKQKDINAKAQKMVDGLNLRVDVRKEIRDTGIGEKFFTEICRCMVGKAKIVIMDEPTSAMTPNEYQHFLITIKLLREKNISIIYISHRLQEIFEICDSVSVMRDGKIIRSCFTKDITLPELVKCMIGKEANCYLNYVEQNDFRQNKVVLKLNSISTHKLKNVSFELKEGEILGVTGLLGAGKSELAHVLFGVDKLTNGEIDVDGKRVIFKHPRDAMNKGLAFVSEDRKEKGLFQDFSIRNNISITSLSKFEKARFFVDRKNEKKYCKKMAQEFRVKHSSIEQLVRYLSGGNQQKVVLSKWIARAPKILILDEPTRGIDVGSKEEIYSMIKELTKTGMSVLLLSSEIEEVIAVSDRIIVLHDGAIKGSFTNSEASQEKILLVAAGGKNI